MRRNRAGSTVSKLEPVSEIALTADGVITQTLAQPFAQPADMGLDGRLKPERTVHRGGDLDFAGVAVRIDHQILQQTPLAPRQLKGLAGDHSVAAVETAFDGAEALAGGRVRAATPANGVRPRQLLSELHWFDLE